MEFERALVTGASGGIGEALAGQLAARGVDLVLVARSGDRLEELAATWRSQHGVAVEVLAADLTAEAQAATVESRVRSERRPVDLLVNNAGVGSVRPFVETDLPWLRTQVALNIDRLVALTHQAVPRMVAAGHGGVLNVSSVGGFQPVPGMGVYAATKAFVTSFTEALHEELRGSGVHVTALCPGFTRTGFAAAADAVGAAARLPDLLWDEPESVARAGIDGVRKGRAVVVPGGLNQLASAVSQLSPSSVSRRLVGLTFARLSG